MSEAIIVTIISGLVTLAGVIVANSKSHAVTQNEIKHLTEEVRKHNGFAEKIPVIEEKIKVANNRLADCEHQIDELRKERMVG